MVKVLKFEIQFVNVVGVWIKLKFLFKTLYVALKNDCFERLMTKPYDNVVWVMSIST